MDEMRDDGARVPVPGFLGLRFPDLPSDLEGEVLSLYSEIAECHQGMQRAVDEANRSRELLGRSKDDIIADLATLRYDLGRLETRLRDVRAEDDRASAAELLADLCRSFDRILATHRVDVVDLTGRPLDSEVMGDIEVREAIQDESVSEPSVRDVLTPLVRVDGRTVRLSSVLTSVPPQRTEERQREDVET